MSALPDENDVGQATRLIVELSAAELIDPSLAHALSEEVTHGLMPNTRDAVVDFLAPLQTFSEFQLQRLRKGGVGQLKYGPYLLLEAVTQDQSFGVKYLAESSRDQKRYNLRLFPLRNLFKHQQTKKILNQFQQVESDPQLNVLADVDTANAMHYLAWPAVDGPNLEEIIHQQGPLESDLATKLAKQVLDVFEQIHRLGLAHGLIQPQTLLVNNDSVKLLEFGLGTVWAANLQDSAGAMDTVAFASLGAASLDYTSPEQLANNTTPTKESDLYSLGCTLYFACTGQVPYPEAAAVAKIQGHLSGTAVPARRVNPALDSKLSDLIDGLMSKDREKRSQAVSDWISVQFAPAASTVISQSLTQAKMELMTVGDARTGSSSQSLPFELSKRNGQHGSSGSVSFDLDDIPLTPVPDNDQPSDEYPLQYPEGRITTSTTPTPPAPIRKVELSSFKPLPVAETPVTPRRAANKSQLNVMPVPVNLNAGNKPANDKAARPEVVMPQLPIQHSRPFRTARSLMFWKKKADTVQLSVFGPPEIAPGQRVEFHVYAHLPEAFEGVATLGRALRNDVELLGTGYVEVPVPRQSQLGLHLALENAGVAKSLRELEWVGHTSPRNFEVFVPWESPAGLATGLLSAGLNNERVATITLSFVITPRGL